MDILLQTATAIGQWPIGSNARAVQVSALRTMVKKRQGEVNDAEQLLELQWAWLNRNEGQGEPERYMQKEAIFLSTLADYEDLADGLAKAAEILQGAA